MTNEEAKATLLDHFNWCSICEDETCETCYVTGIKTAVKAIEKQIPQKPFKNRLEYFCPTGDGQVVGKKSNGRVTFSNYCPHCGQAIDWSDK